MSELQKDDEEHESKENYNISPESVPLDGKRFTATAAAAAATSSSSPYNSEVNNQKQSKQSQLEKNTGSHTTKNTADFLTINRYSTPSESFSSSHRYISPNNPPFQYTSPRVLPWRCPPGYSQRPSLPPPSNYKNQYSRSELRTAHNIPAVPNLRPTAYYGNERSRLTQPLYNESIDRRFEQRAYAGASPVRPSPWNLIRDRLPQVQLLQQQQKSAELSQKVTPYQNPSLASPVLLSSSSPDYRSDLMSNFVANRPPQHPASGIRNEFSGVVRMQHSSMIPPTQLGIKSSLTEHAVEQNNPGHMNSRGVSRGGISTEQLRFPTSRMKDSGQQQFVTNDEKIIKMLPYSKQAADLEARSSNDKTEYVPITDDVNVNADRMPKKRNQFDRTNGREDNVSNLSIPGQSNENVCAKLQTVANRKDHSTAEYFTKVSINADDVLNGKTNNDRIANKSEENESKQNSDKKLTPNGDIKPPSTLPVMKKEKSVLKTPTKKMSPKSPESASSANSLTSDKKKVPMNKVQVGSAPSPNLKVVRSKIGSLENYTHKPGGGKVKIENRKLEWNASPRIEAKNEKYAPSGGDKKITQVKLQWSAKSKIGSLENATHKPGGGDKKIENVKLDFKDKAKPKVGSKDNIKHTPGGGIVKKSSDIDSKSITSDIEDQKIELNVQSKVGSLDNVKHRPGGGDKKIFDDKEYLKQMATTTTTCESSKANSVATSGSQSPAHT